jgi:hypothetical protein
MGYMHIKLLHKYPDFLKLFQQIYALEKIHGTSAWLTYTKGQHIQYHSGGSDIKDFMLLFNSDELEKELDKILDEYSKDSIRIHGEAYGGKMQKMWKTYGSKLKFVALDVFMCDKFLNVEDAEAVVKRLNLEFVDYVCGPNTIEFIEEQTNRDSIQAIRNGMGLGNSREGIILRPLEETYIEGKRIILKHKTKEFSETRTNHKLGEQVKVIENEQEITDEYLTDERCRHVIDRIIQNREKKEIGFTDVKTFLELMVEDIRREAEGEIVWSKKVAKHIRCVAGNKFKAFLAN